MKTKVVYVAQFDDNAGYASAARGYLKCLDLLENDIDLNLFSIQLESKNSIISEEERDLVNKYRFNSVEDVYSFIKNNEYILIWHLPPVFMGRIHNKAKDISEKNAPYKIIEALMKHSAENINISAWEADKIPDTWLRVFNKHKTKKIVVPSTWNKEVYSKSVNPEKVFYIPHLLHIPTTTRKPVKLPIDIEKTFILFYMSQWNIRKGFDSLITAYSMEFGLQEDTCLLLKTYGAITNDVSRSDMEEINSFIRDGIKKYKKSVYLEYEKTSKAKIVPLVGVMPYENINYLYDISDCFVSPSKGEGFGLTIAEAVTNNTPVIVSNCGGHIDYLPKDGVKYFSGHWTPVHSIPGYTCEMKWYEPDITSLRKQMRNAYNEWKAGKSITMSKPEFYSREQIAKEFKKLLTN